MATIRWCPIFPKWDIYQPLWQEVASPVAPVAATPLRPSGPSGWQILWRRIQQQDLTGGTREECCVCMHTIACICICTSSTRTRRGGSCLKDIYKTFLIYRTCMRRAPAKPVRACTPSPCSTSHFTLDSLHTPHYTLHTALFTLHSSHCTLRSQHFTSHCTLKTPHCIESQQQEKMPSIDYMPITC